MGKRGGEEKKEGKGGRRENSFPKMIEGSAASSSSVSAATHRKGGRKKGDGNQRTWRRADAAITNPGLSCLFLERSNRSPREEEKREGKKKKGGEKREVFSAAKEGKRVRYPQRSHLLTTTIRQKGGGDK